ncbi:DUF748 domain-containing protein [Pseudocolwellia agarivorans]|uniref:DUF748 domain-containing protein n=1 Tax=Pseudocolwellia agarivorans TaxID=1911682 RepID=UPI0009841110|nr:DUF748 domain-containing protein [Pseudocolwellia agarivorans]
MPSKSLPLYKRILFTILAFIFALYCLIWVLSSPIIKHFAKEPLAEYGLTLSSDSTISFNPFLTRITVADLALLKDNSPVLKAEQLALQLALHKIPFDIIKLEEFSIKGVVVNVEKTNDDLWVAGVNLTPKSAELDPQTKPEIEEATEKNKKSTPTEPSPYQVQLDNLVLSNTTIDILLNGSPHAFDIKELLISNINASQAQQSANLKLNALFDKAAIKLTSEFNLQNNEGDISSKLIVSKYSLNNIKHLIEPVESLDGLFSFSSNQNVKITSQGMDITVKQAELSTENVITSTKEQNISLENLVYSMNDFSMNIANNELEKNQLKAITGTAQLTLKNALVEALPSHNEKSENDKSQQILSFAQLNVNNITPKLSAVSESDLTLAPSVFIESLDLNQLLFSQNTTNELPPVATINNINISDIAGSAEALSINEINIDSITSHIILNKEKALANLVTLTPAKETESEAVQEVEQTAQTQDTATSSPKVPETATPETTTQKPFYISVNAFNIINKNQIDFIDNSVNPIYKRSFMIDELTMGKLSNLQESTEAKTPITLKGRSNEYANFAFNGFIQPFAKKKTYHIKGDLNELSLPDVSTYMKDALKLELKSGQLNTKLDVTLIDDDIDGDVSININGLETAAANNHETNLVKDQVGIPFNVALGMLKDGNGDLILDVPLSGKTSSPSFGISSFIALITKKAVMSATQDYLMTTFVPYANIVSVAMTAGEFILKLRFEDLPYEPKQVTPNEKQAEYIKQFIAVMKDQKNTRVKICAISTPSDIGLPAKHKLSEADIKALKTIGDERERAFKASVVQDKQIETGRILLCTPQIDNSEGAIPRMVISV